MKKNLSLLVALILSGCNGDSVPYLADEYHSYNTTNIYAGSAGNYGRAFMLSDAFAKNTEFSILALGVTEADYPFIYESEKDGEFKIKEIENDYSKISEMIIEASDGDAENDTNLYLGVIPVTNGQILSDEAFGRLTSIYLVPEGTSLLTYQADRIDNIIAFAKSAKAKGVKSVKLVLWDSIDEQALLNSDLQIARLKDQGIEFDFVSFNKMANEIKANGNSAGLISSSIYSGAIGESVLDEPIFSKNSYYDDSLKNVVLFGSYTKDDAEVSFLNQVEILKSLEQKYDMDEYNILFKGHPREVTVNDWIDENSKRTSYFKSFPYEIWQVLGKGEFDYEYNGVKYTLELPEAPSKIYSIFSTTLYGEDADKIEMILGYNSVNDAGELIDEVHPITSYDLVEYDKWKSLTGEDSTPFLMTYDWINQ